jgi:hypothetical protein
MKKESATEDKIVLNLQNLHTRMLRIEALLLHLLPSKQIEVSETDALELMSKRIDKTVEGIIHRENLAVFSSIFNEGIDEGEEKLCCIFWEKKAASFYKDDDEGFDGYDYLLDHATFADLFEVLHDDYGHQKMANKSAEALDNALRSIPQKKWPKTVYSFYKRAPRRPFKLYKIDFDGFIFISRLLGLDKLIFDSDGQNAAFSFLRLLEPEISDNLEAKTESLKRKARRKR